MTDGRFVFASARAAQVAGELGVDVDRLEGTGAEGRITVADVRAADPTGPPQDLGEAGRGLWKSIQAALPDDFRFDEREIAILTMACHQADDVASCEKSVREDGATVKGSTGQVVVHPALIQARQGRVAISRLLGELELRNEEDQPPTAAGRRGKRAAESRWAQRRAQMSLVEGR